MERKPGRGEVDRRSGNVLNVPNALTGLRFLAVPLFAVLFVRGRLGAALGVFIGAMVTDWLDGIAARALKQFTLLGAMMDPLADKTMGLTAMALLAFSGWLPRALLWLLLARDAAIFLALWVLGRLGRRYDIRPTRFGKYATAFVTVTIVLGLVEAARDERHSPAVAAFALVTALCIAVSWGQYFAWFLQLVRGPAKGRPDATA